jgi:hypothetical protein
MNTFHARLYGLDEKATCKAGQRACNKTVIGHSLKFGFSNGWVTVHPDGHSTVFDMLKMAEKHPICNGQEITEITLHEYL